MSFRPLWPLLAVLCALPLHAGEPVATPAAAPARTAMPVQELARRIESGDAPALILDTRTREEYDAGHVPRARLIPHDEILAALDNLKAFRHEEIVIYCRSGRRSALAEATLREQGFDDVTQLDGSWLAWEAARLPVEATTSERPQ